MWKKSKVTEQTASGQAGIRKKSKVPGVMITQFVEQLPEGKTTPDFTRKPIALTIQEGKTAVFKAKVTGTPAPTITWSRANGEIYYHPDICLQKYDEASHEHTLQFPKVSPEDADTYKCFATNEYGKAVCTVLLNVIEVGFSRTKEFQKTQEADVADFRKKLRKCNANGVREEKAMESEEKVWEILLSADKTDYERICAEYGITDFRGMLKKLTEMKREREEEISEFVSQISALKHIDVKQDNCATIELDMDLKDPSSKIFLYKDGVMVPFTVEESESMKHSLKQVGKKYVFTIKNLGSDDAGLYSVDVEGVNVFSTEFKVPEVDFAVKIQEIKALEREDALFQCVLTAPMNEIKWFGKNTPLSNSEKHEIIVSEDKLIHKLIVRDCLPLDAGIYAVVAGIKSCNAWLVVEADRDPANKGKKAARKTTIAGGGNSEDLIRIAKDQKERHDKEMAKKMENIMKAQVEKEAAEAAAQATKKAGKEAKVEGKAAKVTAKSKRAADIKTGTTSKTKNKEAGAAAGGSSSAPAAIARSVAGSGKAGASEKGGGSKTAVNEGTEAATGAKCDAGGGVGVGTKGEAEEFAVDEVQFKAGATANGATDDNQVGVEYFVQEDEGEDHDSCEDSDIENGQDSLVPDPEIAIIDDEETTNDKDEKSWKNRKHLRKKNLGVVEEAVEMSAIGGEKTKHHQAKQAEMNLVKMVGVQMVMCSGQARQGPLIAETVSDPGVHFHSGLSDCKVIIGEAAALECKLSSEECNGKWYKDGEEIKSDEGITISKEGSFHRLKIQKVTEEYAGKYKFEADGRKTEALIVVEDPPRFDVEDLEAFKTTVTVKKGHKAIYKLPFIGREPIKVQWYLDGEELSDEANIKLEHSDGSSRLILTKLQRKDSGEVKIKLKNEFGTIEAFSRLIVLDKPTPPMGPLEIVDASSSVIEFKWRPPKDSGGCKIGNYILERQQIGRNTWKKLGPIGPDPTYKDTDVDHGRRYCYRIRVETEMGTSEIMETEDIQAGTKAYPGPPSAPKVVSAFKDCINLAWSPPANTGGTNILGYNLEKRKKGSNLWGLVNPCGEIIRAKGYAVKDVIEGMEYEFRVSAINTSGAGEFSTPSEYVFARDPKKAPGKVQDFKVTDSTYTTLSLSWNKPKEIDGMADEAKGYFIEIRPAESTEWDRCNSIPITMTSYTVKGLKSMAMYWVRVVATNDGGEGEAQELANYILATPPPVRPRFTDGKIKSFMVVRAGNSARFNINFEASPWPDITWQKDGGPVSKKVTISNTEGQSQLLIPSAERTDTGIYTIIVKNIVGQEAFSIEIRVTDEPKPAGPVELDENVPGTVTISWAPSPDEKRDDRLHYMVMKRDSVKRQWHSIADHIFNNRFTACNIMPGRDYQFRVYAKNDMGSSKPSESPKWFIPSRKEKFTLIMPKTKVCDMQCAPKFMVPLKLHTAPQGYECYMTCALKGDPMPHVTWLRNNVILNTNTNYHITNTCGVCSLLILRVGPKDTGEYKIVAENVIGRAECSTKLTVRE